MVWIDFYFLMLAFARHHISISLYGPHILPYIIINLNHVLLIKNSLVIRINKLKTKQIHYTNFKLIRN